MGAVLRKPDGTFSAAVVDFIPNGTTFMAEAMDVRLGLMMARHCNITHLQLQVDATSLLKGILKNEVEVPWTTRSVFKDINSLISVFVSFDVISVYREANYVADALAKLGATTCSFGFWNEAPPDIIK